MSIVIKDKEGKVVDNVIVYNLTTRSNHDYQEKDFKEFINVPGLGRCGYEDGWIYVL